MPGRGPRTREAPFRDIDARIPALIDAIRGALDLPFALFGHDLGALIAFELARGLRRANLPSADLEESEFRAALRGRANVPAEVVEHAELMELVSRRSRGAPSSRCSRSRPLAPRSDELQKRYCTTA